MYQRNILVEKKIARTARSFSGYVAPSPTSARCLSAVWTGHSIDVLSPPPPPFPPLRLKLK